MVETHDRIPARPTRRLHRRTPRTHPEPQDQRPTSRTINEKTKNAAAGEEKKGTPASRTANNKGTRPGGASANGTPTRTASPTNVFAACSILGYAFIPRIRDLPSKRLYVFERAVVPKPLRPLVGGKVNVDLIDRNWADILRVAATMAAGTLRPSQILRKLAAYPRQNELAAALREVGRIERSLFMIELTTDPDVRRRASVGLNKGRGAPCPQARHQLSTSAANCGTEPRKGSTTGSPASTCFARKQAGLAIPAELLAHVSPLGWEHINLTGEYRWPGTDRRATRNGLGQ